MPLMQLLLRGLCAALRLSGVSEAGALMPYVIYTSVPA